MIGRENFDYVTMDTYRADMAESTAQADGIIAHQKREIEGMERTIWLLVKAAGGSIKIPCDVLARFDARACNVNVERMDYDMSLVVSVQ